MGSSTRQHTLPDSGELTPCNMRAVLRQLNNPSALPFGMSGPLDFGSGVVVRFYSNFCEPLRVPCVSSRCKTDTAHLDG